MRTLEEYENAGFQGGDVSLEISLYEYGLIWKLEENTENEYKFIYGVNVTEGEFGGYIYNEFDWSNMSKIEFTDMIDSSWFDLPKFAKFVGIDAEKIPDYFPGIIQECISYHGAENVFGSSYYTFKVENNE